ncbi:MAG: carboxypeptidase regulatory-like domain-containing protein [Pyrinomonadaceae bacterium]
MPLAVQSGRNVIEGNVIAGDRPLSEAHVFLKNDGYGEIKQTYTDGSGRFRFAGLQAGNYYVEVDPLGTDYQRQTQRVEAQPFGLRGGNAAEIFRVNFQLVAQKPKNGAANDSRSLTRGSKRIVFYQDVPETAKVEFQRGAQSLKENAFDTGAASLKRSLEMFPDYYDALVLLGTAYVNRDEFENALPLLKHAVEVNKNGWLAFYSLGIAQTKSNQLADGTEALRHAVELNPQSVEASMDYAKALAKNAKTEEEAIQLFKKVTQDHGKDGRDAYFMLASLYSKHTRYNEAADALEAYMKSLGTTEMTQEQKENYSKAIQRLRRKATETKKPD